MIQSIHRESMVEMLLNAIEVERHVRAPLLLTLIDDLAAAATCGHALEVARVVLSELESGALDERGFRRRLAELRAVALSV